MPNNELDEKFLELIKQDKVEVDRERSLRYVSPVELAIEFNTCLTFFVVGTEIITGITWLWLN